jgi:hypothetical protein
LVRLNRDASPTQKPALFNLQAVKEPVDAAVAAGRHGQ